jgi:hypothetical protein
MKKLTKKVVIATTVGIASMLLNAACGYGPPVQEYDDNNSSYETSDSDDAADQKSNAAENTTGSKDDANTLESIDIDPEEYPVPEPADVYGPPVE